MNERDEWTLAVKHEQDAPLGLSGGLSEAEAVPPTGWRGPQPVLRLVMPLAVPVVAVRVVHDALDGGLVTRELTPAVRVERQRVHTYRLDPLETAASQDRAGPGHRTRYEVEWEVRRKGDQRETDGREQLITRVQLVAADPDGTEQVLAATGLTLRWYDPLAPGQLEHLLPKAITSWFLPPPVAAAARELVEANRRAPPTCPSCSLQWELDVLRAADRAWDVAQAHGSIRVVELLSGWTVTRDDWHPFSPCPRHRGRPGPVSARPPGIPDDQLRRDLAAARAREAARHAKQRPR